MKVECVNVYRQIRAMAKQNVVRKRLQVPMSDFNVAFVLTNESNLVSPGTNLNKNLHFVLVLEPYISLISVYFRNLCNFD